MADTSQLRDRSRTARRRGPIFVDSSGRNLGRVRIIGGAALAAVVGYVVLLVVAVLGGPNVAAPYLQPPVHAPQAASTPTRTPAAPPSDTPAAEAVEAVPAAVAEPASAQQAPAAAPATGEPAATAPAAPAEAAPSSDVEPGKSEVAPGQQSARPTAPAKP